jgi:regulator of sigma E protease
MGLIILLPLGLVALSLIVFIHELGHFIAAKLTGVKVEEFGLGFPPRVWFKKRGETEYSLNALPIGGFVRLHGESADDAVKEKDRAFINKSGRVRIIIALAGVAMNFVLALFAFSAYYSFVPLERGVRITQVSEDSPAQVGGIKPNDTILTINGEKLDIDGTEKFKNIIDAHRGQEVVLEVKTLEKGKEVQKTLRVIPRDNPPENQGSLGVTMTPIDLYYPPIWQRPIYGMKKGFGDTITFANEIVSGFVKLGSDVSSGKAPEGLEHMIGILGILALFSEVFRYGILETIRFIGVISLNLAIINLLPFPPLDGSRILFVGIERIFGKKAVPKIEAKLHPIGMIILLLLMLGITGREIIHLIQAGSISGFIKGLWVK